MTTADDRTVLPAYRRQKRRIPPDYAFVEYGGQRQYLGAYGSPESREAYRRFLVEWQVSYGRPATPEQNTTITELLNYFRKHAASYYRSTNGQPSKEYKNFLPGMKMLRELYGQTPVSEFTPRNLKAVRQAMIEHGWTRRHINREVVRLRTIFKWGVSEGLVPVTVHQALGTLDGLRAGRGDVAEAEPVRPVAKELVKSIFPHVARVIRDMVRLQWYTGMRPGEVCLMRPIDIDMTGPTWVYRPAHHKGEWRGRERAVPLGPKARRVIERYLAGRPADAYMFSPQEADRQRRDQRHADRTTPLSCGNKPGTNKSVDPQRHPGQRYTTSTYARAVAYGCEATWRHPEISKVPKRKRTPEQKFELRRWNAEHRWTPNQLRHAAATRIRKIAGLEMARVVLGHSTMAVTETYYAEADLAKAARLMSKIG